jgi:hypothetical protein
MRTERQGFMRYRGAEGQLYTYCTTLNHDQDLVDTRNGAIRVQFRTILGLGAG